MTNELLLVFLAGLFTDLAAGLGALPFLLVEEVNDRLYVFLWGIAAGVMLSASVFGLLPAGLALSATLTAVGILVGVGLIVVSRRVLSGYEFHPKTISEVDFRKLVLIVGTLTVHSFPEGVAIGVAFGGVRFGGVESGPFGVTVPVLAVFITVAIAIQNVPEGLAVAIPLKTSGVSNRGLVGWALFSSLPQPFMAVLAFSFVSVAQSVLPLGFGFAAGAMVYLVLSELLPEAVSRGAHLPGRGHREVAAGLVIGGALMLPFLLVG
jgi:ZIP family zinc transporter